MLKHLKRWLGWDSDSALLDFSDFRLRPHNPQPPPKPVVVTQTRAAEPPAPRVAEPAPASQRRTKTERAPVDVLNNPRLTLDKPVDDVGFDPYNTGAFNRSTSWEKIGRQRKR
jgi:hypothetical protein